MKSTKSYFVGICLMYLLLISGAEVSAQNQKIRIFDPNNISNNFQSSFNNLSNDTFYVINSFDESIKSFDALFIFLDEAYDGYRLSQEEGNHLINYVNLGKPIYLYTDVWNQDTRNVTFWDHIGVNGVASFLPVFGVDSVIGVNTTFTENVVIDTSFISYDLPYVYDNVTPVLIGKGGFPLQTTYISSYDSIRVIIDFFNLIYHTEYYDLVKLFLIIQDLLTYNFLYKQSLN